MAHGVGKFSLVLTSGSNHRPIEDIIISINLGQGTTGVSATATGDRRPPGVSSGLSGGARPGGLSGNRNDMIDGFADGGTWEYDPHTQVLRWCISSLTVREKAPTLTGSFTST